MVALAIKYRPTDFASLVGQRLSGAVLDRMVQKDQVPDGILFVGPSGTGKTTAARVLAHALDTEPIEIDAASNGGVDAIRTLIESLRYGYVDQRRVVIIDEAQSVTRDGFNTLLKTLEEPPAGTIFVLCTTEPEKIPETVAGRLIEFEFRRVSPQDIHDRLTWVCEQEQIEVAPAILADISERAEGSVRVGLMLLDQVHRAGIDSKDDYDQLLGLHDTIPRLMAAIVLGKRDRVFDALDIELQTSGSPVVVVNHLIRMLRDITVLHGGGTLDYTGSSLEVRRQLAARTHPEQVYAASRVLWELKTRVRFTDDPRGNLELAAMLLLDTFTRDLPREAVVPSEQKPAKKMSLAEMRGTP